MKERFKRLKCCIIISSHAIGDELLHLVAYIQGLTDEKIIICTTDYKSLSLHKALKNQDQLVFISPKFADIRHIKSLRIALELGYDHALWLEDIPQIAVSTMNLLLNEIELGSQTLIIGTPTLAVDTGNKQTPLVQKIGHASFWFKTGMKLDALQSGLRLYPIRKMQAIRFIDGGCGFEKEALVKAIWSGIPVKNIQINDTLNNRVKRKTFGTALRNFSQLSLLNTYLVALALFFYVPLRFLKLLSKENIRAFIKKNFFDRSEPIYIKALSIAFGVFMAFSPFIGFQLLIGIPLAHFLRLNKALFVTAANINIPPIIPFLIWGSFKLGAAFIENPKGDLFLSQGFNADVLKENFLQYGIGALVLASISALLAGLISYTWLYIARSKRIALEAAAVEV